MKASQYISEWRRLCLFSNDDATAVIYRTLYALRRWDRVPIVDDILGTLKIDEFSTTALLAIIVATVVVARQLNNREAFFKAVKARLITEKGEAEANDLLYGLAAEEGWKRDNE